MTLRLYCLALARHRVRRHNRHRRPSTWYSSSSSRSRRRSARAATPPMCPMLNRTASTSAANLLYHLSPGGAGGGAAAAAENGDEEEEEEDEDEIDERMRRQQQQQRMRGAPPANGARGKGPPSNIGGGGNRPGPGRPPKSRYVENGDDDDEEDDDEDGADVIDLRGLADTRAAIDRRLQVTYMERQGKSLVKVPYRGSVVSVDFKKGLRVKLDGYVRREWVTDEDEWTWLPEHDSAPLPHQLELMAAMAENPEAEQQGPNPVGRPPSKPKQAGGGNSGDRTLLTASGKAKAIPPAQLPLPRAPGTLAANTSNSHQPAFVAASLVRLRLRGEKIMELPRSLTDKPRRSSAVRPLPGMYLGASAEAKDEAYDDRIAAEKAARKVTKKEKKEVGGDGGGVSPLPLWRMGRGGKGSKKAVTAVEAPPSAENGNHAKKGGKKGGKAASKEEPAAAQHEEEEEEVEGMEGRAFNCYTRDACDYCAGPHAGVEAKVLHVGNGWVKLQLPYGGGVVHLRKWDLSGAIVLQARTAKGGGGGDGGEEEKGGEEGAGGEGGGEEAAKATCRASS